MATARAARAIAPLPLSSAPHASIDARQWPTISHATSAVGWLLSVPLRRRAFGHFRSPHLEEVRARPPRQAVQAAGHGMRHRLPSREPAR